MKILNLTQHPATAEQKAAGVVDLEGAALDALKELLTFGSLPSGAEIRRRAAQIAVLAAAQDEERDAAMIGGAPYLMADLEVELENVGFIPVYAFSQRETEEQTQPDGSVRKVNVFRHAGFVGLPEEA